MSTALWVKSGKGLKPADEITATMLDGYKQGAYIRTSAPQQPRNPKHHKLMMAILTKVVEHTWPRFADVDRLMRWLKLRCGQFQRIAVTGNIVSIEMESIAFDKMDQKAFKTLSDAWLAIICEELMPGTDPEELLKEAA